MNRSFDRQSSTHQPSIHLKSTSSNFLHRCSYNIHLLYSYSEHPLHAIPESDSEVVDAEDATHHHNNFSCNNNESDYENGSSPNSPEKHPDHAATGQIDATPSQLPLELQSIDKQVVTLIFSLKSFDLVVVLKSR